MPAIPQPPKSCSVATLRAMASADRSNVTSTWRSHMPPIQMTESASSRPGTGWTPSTAHLGSPMETARTLPVMSATRNGSWGSSAVGGKTPSIARGPGSSVDSQAARPAMASTTTNSASRVRSAADRPDIRGVCRPTSAEATSGHRGAPSGPGTGMRPQWVRCHESPSPNRLTPKSDQAQGRQAQGRDAQGPRPARSRPAERGHRRSSRPPSRPPPTASPASTSTSACSPRSPTWATRSRRRSSARPSRCCSAAATSSPRRRPAPARPRPSRCRSSSASRSARPDRTAPAPSSSSRPASSPCRSPRPSTSTASRSAPGSCPSTAASRSGSSCAASAAASMSSSRRRVARSITSSAAA